MITLVKVGGAILEKEDTLAEFIDSFIQVPRPKILVHGGGRTASDFMQKLGIEPLMHNGRRITDQATLDVVTMVYGGLINKNVVAKLQAKGCNTAGFTGADMALIEAVKRPVKDVDYGFAGDIVNVNAQQILRLLEQGITPILAPLTLDKKGSLLNTNADTIASAVSVALAELVPVALVYSFEKEGVLDNNMNVIPSLTFHQYTRLVQDGVVKEGMIPKLDNAFAALQQGLSVVRICHSLQLHTKNGTYLTA